MLALKGPVCFTELFNFSLFSIIGWGIGLDYCDTEWFALEMNRDYSVVFETASEYCISDSFADYDSSQRWRSSIQSAKTRPGADCGSDHELLIAKFRLKLKKAGKTPRPFRYDMNQIPYDYSKVGNRLKGLDLIDLSAWWTMDGASWHCTGDRDQEHP